MKNIVQYLSYYPEQGGLVFPQELPENYYSLGKFYVMVDESNKLKHEYYFDAEDNGVDVRLVLKQKENSPGGNLYTVETEKYGIFPFSIEPVHHVYKGTSNKLRDVFLYRVIPLNKNKLEDACNIGRFFFCGSNDL